MRITIFFSVLLLFFVFINWWDAQKSYTEKFYELNIVSLKKDYRLSRKVSSPLLVEEYSIQNGDSFWNLAKKFDIGIETIISFNKVKKVHFIRPGRKVFIPNKNGLLVLKKKNQSLREVSKQYNANFKNISFFNLASIFDNAFFLKDVELSFSKRLELLGAEFLKPLKVISISSRYGFRIHPVTKKRSFHYGLDFRGRIGDKVYAAKGGRVIFSGSTAGYGKVVYILHKKGYRTIYAHLGKLYVKSGQRVGNQQLIGLLGNTGISTGPHLHFEIWKNGKAINPLNVLDIY